MFSIENKTKEKMERRYAALFNDDLLWESQTQIPVKTISFL